jgi:acetate kinase
MSVDAVVPVAISARHVHLTPASVARLFGPEHVLSVHSQLAQPGQFAAEETVTLIGPHGELPHVRVVGPPRTEDQVEVSRSEALKLGLDAPVRVSGQLAGTPGVTLVGPAGTITLEHGVVLAKRHIHMTPDDARRLGVHDREIVEVAVDSHGRDLVFGDVVVRVSSDYRLEFHLDTDEGNAAGLHDGDPVRLLTPVLVRARLRRTVVNPTRP